MLPFAVIAFFTPLFLGPVASPPAPTSTPETRTVTAVTEPSALADIPAADFLVAALPEDFTVNLVSSTPRRGLAEVTIEGTVPTARSVATLVAAVPEGIRTKSAELDYARSARHPLGPLYRAALTFQIPRNWQPARTSPPAARAPQRHTARDLVAAFVASDEAGPPVQIIGAAQLSVTSVELPAEWLEAPRDHAAALMEALAASSIGIIVRSDMRLIGPVDELIERATEIPILGPGMAAADRSNPAELVMKVIPIEPVYAKSLITLAADVSPDTTRFHSTNGRVFVTGTVATVRQAEAIAAQLSAAPDE